MTIRVAILGAGHMGRTHGLNLAADRRAQIVGVADVAADRAQALARELGAQACTGLEDLLALGVDALYVTTPNTQHTKAVLAALGHGKHVFSEKPMATSLAEAQQIAEAVAAGRSIYQVGHNRRFAPVYKFARQAITAGLVPFSANVKMNRGELKNPVWVSDRAITGGFLYESTIHLLDMVRWLMGDVVEVYCRAATNIYGEPDDWVAILTFDGGRVATFSSCAHAAWGFPFERIELFGEHASLVTEEMDRVLYTQALNRETVVYDYARLGVPERWGYAEEDSLFLDAVSGGGPAPVTAEDGLKAVELVDAFYRSAEEGRAVSLR